MCEPSQHSVSSLFLFFSPPNCRGKTGSTSIIRAERVVSVDWPELQHTLWWYWHKREGHKDHPSAQMLFSAYRVTPQTSVTVLLSAQSQLESEYA